MNLQEKKSPIHSGFWQRMCTPSVPQLGNTPKRLLLFLMLLFWLFGGEGALAHPADERVYGRMSDGGADCSEFASWFHGLSGTLGMTLVGVGCGIGLIGSLAKRKYGLALCYSTLILGIYVIRSLFLVWCDQHPSFDSGSNGPTTLDLYASELKRSHDLAVTGSRVRGRLGTFCGA